MSLTVEQLRQRDGKLTASRIGVLMHGDEAELLDLWRELVGDPSYHAPDFDSIWAVQLGVASEALNLAWYERKTGRKLTRQGEVVVCPAADWAAATLDAWDAEKPGPIDAKHVGGFEPRDRIVARYTPQMFWQMIVTGARWSALSIIEGAREPVIEEVLWDESYAAELWKRAEAFMEAVRTLTPPVTLAPVAAPVAPEQWRTVSMQGNNAWASHAADWLLHHPAAKKFEAAAKEIKALIEADVGIATGHGLVCKRDKANRLSISAMK
jgi:predicted phage-related endonuclease